MIAQPMNKKHDKRTLNCGTPPPQSRDFELYPVYNYKIKQGNKDIPRS